MTPIDFSRWYEYDERSVDGGYYSCAPLDVSEGDRVGVVLMNLGGPRNLGEVEAFLYHLLMDPAFLDLPVGGGLRHWFCKALASYWSDSVRDQFELIGGGSPLTRLTHEQAESLEEYLTDQFGEPAGVDFHTYVSMRYGHPSAPEAAAQMEEDGIDRVVLLPLYPQYSRAMSGSSLAYWKALEDRDEIPSWPTTTVFEYSANPKYIQAISERIDEGLQRFPRDRRDDVHLLFNAHGMPLRERYRREDPYCCHVHSTVERVMEYRDHDHQAHTAFQNKVGLRSPMTPTTMETLEAIADGDDEAILVIPLTFATDHFLTSYGLDIDVREQAELFGITHFEVTSGLNTHPLFIEALSEAALSQLDLPIDVNQLRIGGDGLAQDYPLRPIQELPRYESGSDSAQCPFCNNQSPARRWTVSDDVPDSDAIQPGNGQDPTDAPSEPSETRA